MTDKLKPKPKYIQYHAGRVNYSAFTIEELASYLEQFGTPQIIVLNGKYYKIVEETLQPATAERRLQ